LNINWKNEFIKGIEIDKKFENYFLNYSSEVEKISFSEFFIYDENQIFAYKSDMSSLLYLIRSKFNGNFLFYLILLDFIHLIRIY